MKRIGLYMRKNIVLLTIGSVVILLIASMNHYRISKSEDVGTIVSNMIGDTLLFAKYVNVDQNQTILIDSVLNSPEYKIVSYVDSSDCYSCHLQLKRWKEYISEISDDKNELQVLFIFGRGTKDDAKNLISKSHWSQPVIYDKDDVFYQQNKIPAQFNFQTMLINKNNVIVAVGNPIMNPRVKSLFNKLMGKDTSHMKITSAEFSCKKVVFDEMQIDSVYQQSIFIKNTGKEKLRVLDVSASCDCVETLVENIDARPDDKIEIVVKYKATNKPNLSERLLIKLNTKPQQTIVNVEGNYKH